MPRKESGAVSEGNGSIPVYVLPGEISLKDLRRIMREVWNLKPEKPKEMRLDPLVASLEHDARQPRLAMVADGQANTKTSERMEGAAKAVQAKYGDSCTAQRVQDRPKIRTCFGVMAEPPALPCRDDVMFENSAAAPKSCLPSLEMRSPTGAGGLLPTGEASRATMTTFNQPPLWLYLTEETDSKKTNLRTPILYVSYGTAVFCLLSLPAGRSLRQNQENCFFGPSGF